MDAKLRLLASLCDRLADTLRDVAVILRAESAPEPLPPYLAETATTTATGWYDVAAAGPEAGK